ncbi:hypothetical protein RUND412_009302 [Rhizina undulata]
MEIVYDHIQEEVIATEAEAPHKKSPAEVSRTSLLILKLGAQKKVAITVAAADSAPSIGSRGVSDVSYASSTASYFKFPEHTAEELNFWDNLESLIDVGKKPADVTYENQNISTTEIFYQNYIQFRHFACSWPQNSGVEV